MSGGRPGKFDPKIIEQAAKLCSLGASDAEIAEFFVYRRSEIEWLSACLLIIRADRRGVIARQKRNRATKRRRYLEQPSKRIENSVRARMWASLKGKSDGALFSRLGYTSDELVAHIERSFLPGMKWANYGTWHVDHVRPCASYDLTDSVQFQDCWALNNLNPLWATDNIRKGAKYVAA